MTHSIKRFNNFLSTLETRWSLWNLIQGLIVTASFGLPAWAIRASKIFGQYAPASWVISGFLGVILCVLIRLIWQCTNSIQVRAKYNSLVLEHDSIFNPLDLTFERKRILINDFALPSHPFIDGKTFIDCDLIGPANIYFHSSNNANPIRPPQFDGVWLAPDIQFKNGFTFTNCIFRNCSFQRVTIFASIENYNLWKDNPSINWISMSPSETELKQREEIIQKALPTKTFIEKSKNLESV